MAFLNPLSGLFGEDTAPSPVQPTGGVRFARETGIGAVLDRYGPNPLPTREEAIFNREEARHQEELRQQQAARAQMRRVLERVNSIRAANPDAPPHTIISQVLQDPTFVEASMTVPIDSLQDMVNEIVKAASPPPPEMKTLSPGQALVSVDPNSGAATPQFSQPTAEVQSNQFLLNLSAEDRAKLAEITLAQNQGKTTQVERATADLLARGLITEQQALDIRAGLLKVVTERDATGAPIGQTLVNLRDNTAVKLQPPADKALPDEPKVPGQETAPVDPGEEPSARIRKLEDPASMFDAVGLLPTVEGAVGRVFGQLDPSLAADDISKRQAAIDRYATAIASLGGFPRLKGVFELLQRNLPERGPTTDPVRELNKAIGNRQLLDDKMRQLRAEYADPATPARLKLDLARDMSAIRQVQLTMPTVEQMERRKAFIIEHGTDFTFKGMTEQLKKGAERATDVLTGKAPVTKRDAEEGGPQFDFGRMTEAQIKQLTREQVIALTPEQRAALKARIQQLKGGR